MWGAFFYWTGLLVWGLVGVAIGLLLALVTHLAAVAAVHTTKFYRHGLVIVADRHWWLSLSAPARIWWHIFVHQPDYLERVDGKGGRIYRPGFKSRRR